ncbi:Polyketide synthase PksJ [Crateriforma conspicua]|uniref:Polyketide synthase PksJ n=1 Tax=Crateriforma conspicua TaxID=2527996 RepID=A0A5C6FW23_9PLAN|nr:polyketide synthase [Crateriforma conspicua]TWU67119.1 Polyketide synthase PksJ [Crateriforma conspicua]
MNDAAEYYQRINAPTVRDFPQLPVHALIDQVCERRPDAIAVLSGDDTQTYRQLKAKSDQLADHLRRHGVGLGDLVGLCSNRDVDTPALLLGILKSGAGYVPLDPEYPPDRLRLMVEDSGLGHIVSHRQQATLIGSFDVENTVVDDWSALANDSDNHTVTKLPAAGDIDLESDVAYVIYTSGSTGKPKGVMVQHQAMLNLLSSMLESPGFAEQDRLLATTTLSFDISVVEMFLPLLAGGSLVVVDRQTAKDANALSAAIDRCAVNFMQATPAMWRILLSGGLPNRADMRFVSAGEPLTHDLAMKLLDHCTELWNLYGPTETTVYSTGQQIEREQSRILIGRPIANTQIFIVDSNDSLCPPGDPGELLIAGEGVTLGYRNRPELNQQRFTDWKGHRVYRTGDLARLTDDGHIDHLGRMDSQIKLDGHRIELGEIDAAMLNHPNVVQAAAVLREDIPGEKRLVGYVIASNPGAADLSQMRKMLEQRLPAYMIPQRFVEIDRFPQTPSGKLDRDHFPLPPSDRPDVGTDYVAPKTEVEKQLAKIWCELLQLDRVGIEDNFLHLGGSSLRAVAMIARADEEIGLNITPAEFFDHPTIASLVTFADTKQEITNRTNSKLDYRITDSNSIDRDAYAIVGMAARMPGAANLQQFWSNLIEGRESIRFFQPNELDAGLKESVTSHPGYVAARGVVDDADQFDRKFFGMTPRDAELTDPQQRIMMELAWTALEDAGAIPGKTQNRIGIWAGTYATTYLTKNLLTHPRVVREVDDFKLGIHNEKDYIATRVAHALDLRGPAVNVNTACSTSLVAVIQACQSLRLGDCDVALAGGVSITFPQNQGHLHQDGSIFSKDGHCRPFDADATGTLFSDGAGVVVLKRLRDAINDSDRVYAVIKGYGINNDGGQKASFSAPSLQGQANAITAAHRMAGFAPESISYVEAHGTATPLGDPIEVSALSKAFGPSSSGKPFCAIGSVKSNIGHTVSAAGVAGLIKVAMSMHHQTIPATINYRKPNPQIPFSNSPFYVCDRPTPWPSSDAPRRAGVSSFGVGGTNAHVVLEDASATAGRGDHRTGHELPFSILPISAKTERSLDGNVGELDAYLQQSNRDDDLSNIAATLQDRRQHFRHRAAVVARSAEEAQRKLNERLPQKFIRSHASPRPRDLVFMYPGQGAQYVRMGQDLYEHSSVFRDCLDECSEILLPLLGRDLRQVMFPPRGDEAASEEILRNTRFTQPALFALGVSLSRMWMAWGFEPSAMIGHSIGEFAAACVSGIFTLDVGLKLIAQRGRLMQELPGGSMLSVRKPGSDVETMLWGDMAIASFNGPNLCVVAGPTDQVSQLQTKLEGDSVACRRLHTSHAFHSPMMDPVVQPFQQFAEQFEFAKPNIPILSTVTGQWMTDHEATDPGYWANHLRAPVRFSSAIQRVWSEADGDPMRILLELGPRKTLSSLAKQHAASPKQQLVYPTLSDRADDQAEWSATTTAIARLWASGTDVNWSKLSCSGAPRKKSAPVSIPTYSFDRERFFIDSPTVEEPPTTEATRSSVPSTQTTPPAQHATMNRLPQLIERIHHVFENSSGFDVSEFSDDTTFFEMGLDSLVLTQTASSLTTEFETEVSFRQLLEGTVTVGSLAQWLDETLPAEPCASPEPLQSPTPAETSIADEANRVHTNVPMQVRSEAEGDLPVNPLNAESQVMASSSSVAETNPKGGLESIVQLQLQAQMQLMQQQLAVFAQRPSPPTAIAQPTVTAQKIQHTTLEPTADQPQSSDHVSSKQQDVDTAKTTDTETTVGDVAPRAKRYDTVKLQDGELDSEQQQALDAMIAMNQSIMPRSKSYAQEHRRYLADPRTVSGFRPNLKEMTHPIVVDRSKGVHLWDIDGNKYIDFTCGFGSNILGHGHDVIVDAITDQIQKDFSIGPQTPLAGEVARIFCELTGHDRMAFSNTGSEAVLGCTRLARNYTGRDLIVMFNGDYHGILDEVVVRGSKKQKSFPAATGIPKDYVTNTLVLEYGAEQSLQIIEDNLDRLAAVLVEPVQSRKPELQPQAFLKSLERMTANQPTALIFDEVISGFRIGLGGAQEHFGVKADLASYGKIVGGGMPIGVVAGRSEYMNGLDGGFWSYGDDSRPEAGMTYFAGTFVRHPLTLAASKAILTHLKKCGPAAYARINALSDDLAEKSNRVFQELNAPMFLANFGSLFKIQFREDMLYSEVFFAGLRRRGIHIWDHRPCLLTLAHRPEHVDQFVTALRDTIVECQQYRFLPGQGVPQTIDANDAQQPTDQSASPPCLNAKLGRDTNNNPAWFVADTLNPGQYVQVGLPS